MRTSANSSPASAIGVRRGAAETASRSTAAVASAIDGQPNVAPIRAASSRAAASASGLSIRSQRASARAAESPKPTSRPGAGRQHVARVPVRRRDDGAAGRERERQRARRALLAVRVRRHEDVGRREEIGELLDREEAVVELDVVAEAEVEDAPLEHQAVLLARAPRDLRMGAACDHVEHLGMALDDRRQRIEHHLDPLARREQTEGREQEARLHARVAADGGGDVARPAARVELGACDRRARSARRAG